MRSKEERGRVSSLPAIIIVTAASEVERCKHLPPAKVTSAFGAEKV